jgi:hypothetical protein
MSDADFAGRPDTNYMYGAQVSPSPAAVITSIRVPVCVTRCALSSAAKAMELSSQVSGASPQSTILAQSLNGFRPWSVRSCKFHHGEGTGWPVRDNNHESNWNTCVDTPSVLGVYPP